MSVRKKVDIGFNRRVRAQWLTETLRLLASGVTHEEIAMTLKAQIAEENQGAETIRKVFTYVTRVWLQPPAYCTALREQALELFRDRPDSDRAFLLNWGMCLAAYPFIGSVAEATGRLLRLQGTAQAAQINVRLRERFGDRPFVHRSVRYNLSTFREFGALKEAASKGQYEVGRIVEPRTDLEAAWLIEALLHAQEDPSLPLPNLLAHGALFPFNMTQLTVTTLKANPRLDIFRHGMNELLVTVKPSNP